MGRLWINKDFNNMINKDTQLFASFSLNPGNYGSRFMNAGFLYHNINAIHKSFKVTNLCEALIAVRQLDIKGFAISMPYKKQILEYVDEYGESVEKIGASNTVVNTNGRLHAYNTDYLAAKAILSTYKYDKSCKPMYILGNGGYAAAVQYAAHQLNIETLVITRENWDQINTITDRLIYNCTPVENLEKTIDQSNIFIDCMPWTPTGQLLSLTQAGHQFRLYTGQTFFISI